MTSYRPRLWHIVLIVLLGLFEFGVFWLAINPNVTDDYRAYYIDRTASCFPREDKVADGSYTLGRPITFVPGRNGHQRDNLRWCGFIANSSTNQGIKTFGDYGILRLRFVVPARICFSPFRALPMPTRRSLRGKWRSPSTAKRSTALIFADSKRVLGEMTIPAAVARANPDGGLDIRFEVPRIAPAGTNKEPVTLQLRLEALRVVAASTESAVGRDSGRPARPQEMKEAGSLPPLCMFRLRRPRACRSLQWCRRLPALQ